MPRKTKRVTETTVTQGRGRSSMHSGHNRHSVHHKRPRKRFWNKKGKQSKAVNLWREEWDECPPSTSECFYYVWNFSHDNYYCPEERDLLSQGKYSKFEIDDFLMDIKKRDLYRSDKQPTGWYYFLSFWACLGIGIILVGLYLWYTSDIKYLWLVAAIIVFIICLFLCIMSCMYCCRKRRHKFLRRREDIMPAVDNENRRIYHRGLNWRLSELGSYLALRTRYKGPVGGFRRRNHHEEMALLNAEDPHSPRSHRKKSRKTKTKTVSKTKTSKKIRGSPRRGRTVVEERVVSPRRSRGSSVVREEVVEIRGGNGDINSIQKSGNNSFVDSNYNTPINLNDPGLNASQKDGAKFKNSHMI